MPITIRCKECNFVLREFSLFSIQYAQRGRRTPHAIYDNLPSECPECGHVLEFPPQSESISIKIRQQLKVAPVVKEAVH